MNIKLLKEIIEYAYNTVPFYKKKYNSYNPNIVNNYDVSILPIITKKDVQNNFNDFISNTIDIVSENVIEKGTSGSTGIPLKIYWDKYSFINSNFPIWRLRQKHHGIKPDSKFCTFHSCYFVNNQDKSNEDYFNSKNCLTLSSINLNLYTIEDKLKKIIEFKPRWLLIKPSIAYLLAYYLKLKNISPPESIKYIEFTGEFLFKEVREYVVDVFKCRTANMYGCEETNVIAYECEYGNLHCLPSNVFVEIMNNNESLNNGKVGNIIITSLTNRTMPFIKYKTEDIGSINTENKCKCQNKSPILKIEAARMTDFISTKKEKISSNIFCHIVTCINKKSANTILQFKIIQNDIDDFLIMLVLKDLSKMAKERTKELFLKAMFESGFSKNIKYCFKFKEILNNEEDIGKFKCFINNKASNSTKRR